MKKLLLFTGAAYGIYMLIKNFSQKGINDNLAADSESNQDGSAEGERTRSNVKAHAPHHGDIRGIMKKASTVRHNVEHEIAAV